MFLVFKFVIRIDKDVVEVGGIEVVEVVEEDVVYIALVRSGTIRESER